MKFAPTPTPLPVDRFDEEFTQPFEFLNPAGDKPFDPREYRPSAPVDAIAPVYSPEFVSADEAELLDDELVMGLEINGDARAYPVGLMRVREMANDIVGGVPVLVTW